MRWWEKLTFLRVFPRLARAGAESAMQAAAPAPIKVTALAGCSGSRPWPPQVMSASSGAVVETVVAAGESSHVPAMAHDSFEVCSSIAATGGAVQGGRCMVPFPAVATGELVAGCASVSVEPDRSDAQRQHWILSGSRVPFFTIPTLSRPASSTIASRTNFAPVPSALAG